MVFQPLQNYGCYVALSADKKTIYTVPMLNDGDMDRDEEPSEVTAPEEGFLKTVNSLFKTSFTCDQFSGR